MKKKFSKGVRICTMERLSHFVESGKYVFLREIPKHPSVMMSMTFHTLKLFVESGQIYAAEEKEK